MKFLVVSDSHGWDQPVFNVIEKEKPIDALIHCGDRESDVLGEVEEKYAIPVYGVQGNCDFTGKYPQAMRLVIGSHLAYIEHGHHSGVKYGYDTIARKAKENGADIAIFGHTHIPLEMRSHGVHLLNPGSLALPHQPSGLRTYMIITVQEDGSYDALLKTYTGAGKK